MIELYMAGGVLLLIISLWIYGKVKGGQVNRLEEKVKHQAEVKKQSDAAIMQVVKSDRAIKSVQLQQMNKRAEDQIKMDNGVRDAFEDDSF